MPADQDSPAWQLFYSFLGILSGIAHEVPDLAGPGFVAFEVEAAYPDAPPGVIPEFEDGPIGAALTQKLPAVLRQAKPELLPVIDLGERFKVAAKLLRESSKNAINEQILKFINYEDGPRPSPASPVTETPEPSLTEIVPAQSVAEARSRFLDALMATVPKEAAYEEQIAQREALRRAFGQRLAADHGESLKAEMRRRPHETYEEKRDLVKWVNSELKRLGLAFKSPKTGQAATFLAKPGHHPEIGIFKIKSVEPDGSEKTFNTPDLETLLSALELMDAPQRREPLAEWHERVGGNRGGAKRG